MDFPHLVHVHDHHGAGMSLLTWVSKKWRLLQLSDALGARVPSLGRATDIGVRFSAAPSTLGLVPMVKAFSDA